MRQQERNEESEIDGGDDVDLPLIDEVINYYYEYHHEIEQTTYYNYPPPKNPICSQSHMIAHERS